MDFVEMMFYPLCAPSPICLFRALRVPALRIALQWLLCHHQAQNSGCKVLAGLVTWEPWLGLWCPGHYLGSEAPGSEGRADSQVSTSGCRLGSQNNCVAI